MEDESFKGRGEPERNQHRPYSGDPMSCVTKEHLSPSKSKPWLFSAHVWLLRFCPAQRLGGCCGGQDQLHCTDVQVKIFKTEERTKRPGSCGGGGVDIATSSGPPGPTHTVLRWDTPTPVSRSPGTQSHKTF